MQIKILFAVATCATGLTVLSGCGRQPIETVDSDGPPPQDDVVIRDFGQATSPAPVIAPESPAQRLTSAEVARRFERPSSFEPAPAAEPLPGAVPEPVEAEEEDEVGEANLPQPGDQILINARFIGNLIPGVQWPEGNPDQMVNVTELIQSSGLVITNYQQLQELGVEEYQIVRPAEPAPEAELEQ
jgi:hypothetical protein